MENGEIYAMRPHDSDADASQESTKFARPRQLNWDKKHLRTVSTKLRKEEYCDLLDACMLWGETPYSLMRRLLRSHVLGRDLGKFRRDS